MKPQRPKTPAAKGSNPDAEQSSARFSIPFRRKTRGAALIEMGIVVGMISVIAIGAVVTVGDETKESFCTAAGALDKAQGGDGYCLNEATAASDPFAPEGTGYANGNFTDMYWPARTTGPQLVLLPIDEGTPGPMVMQAGTEENALEACYRLTPSTELNCAATSIPVPKNAHQVGYRKPLPDDVNAPVDDLVQLSFMDGATATQQWTVSLFREQVGPPFNPTFEFSDKIFAAGTTGAQSVMLEMSGTYSEAMELSVTPTAGGAFGVCTQSRQALDPLCAALAEASTTRSVPADTYALGYTLELPGNLAAEMSEPLTIDLTTPGWAMNARDWNINVSREPMDGDFITALEFGDVALPARATGLRPMESQVLLGAFDEDLILTSDGRGAIPVSPCYVLKEGETPICEPASNGLVTLTVPQDAYSIGYRPKVENQDIFTPYQQQIDLSLASSGMPEARQSWSPTLTRPADVLVFDPQIAFKDTYTLAAGASTHFVALTVGGSYNDEMIATVSNSDGLTTKLVYTVPLFANYYYADSYTLNQGYSEKIGYTVQLGSTGISGWDALSTDLTFTLTSVHNPEVSKSWVMTLERPEKEVVMEPTFAFPSSYTLNAGVKTISRWRQIGGTWNTPMVATVSNPDGFPIKVYYTRYGYGGINSADSVNIGTGSQEDYGYYLNLTSADIYEPLETEIVFKLTSTIDPSITKEWVIPVTRPATPRFNPQVSFQAQSLASDYAGSYDVTFPIDMTGVNIGNVTISAEATGDLNGTWCFDATCGDLASPTAASAEVDALSISDLGARIDLRDSGFDAVSGKIIVTMTPVDQPAMAKSWTLNVTRAQQEVSIDPQVSFQTAFDLDTEEASVFGWSPVTGSWNSPMTATVSTSAGFPVKVAYTTAGESTPTLASSTTIPVGSSERYGISADLSDVSIWEAVDEEVTFTIASQIDPSIKKTWTISITRPAKTPVFEPSVSFSNQTVAADFTGTGQVSFPIDMGATNIGDVYLVSRIVSGDAAAGYCYNGICEGLEITEAQSGPIDAQSISTVGVQWDFSDVPEGYQKSVLLVAMHSVEFPSMSRAWALSVERPAE